MDGMEGAVGVVVGRLGAALPGKTAALRTRYGINPDTGGDQLPDVVTVDGYNRARLGLEEYPAVLVAGMDTTRIRRSEVDAGSTTWLVGYRLRAFIWVRGDDPVRVESVRFRLTLAVRELLLERRTMTSEAMVDDTSLRESYSELAEDKSQATVGAAYIEFTLWVQETLADVDRPAPGVANDVDLDTAALPLHPAL